MKIKMAPSFWLRVKENDDINSICQKYNSNKQNILRNNPELEMYSGEFIKVNVNDYISHFVKPAETLEYIARIYNKNKEKILQENNLNSEKLFIGQCIKIYK